MRVHHPSFIHNKQADDDDNAYVRIIITPKTTVSNVLFAVHYTIYFLTKSFFKCDRFWRVLIPAYPFLCFGLIVKSESFTKENCSLF